MSDNRDYSFIGIDIGGTFTDAVLYDKGGLHVMKTFTTSDDPARGVLKLVELMKQNEFVLTHGSTLATNAVLERRGAPTAFITTEGFSGLFQIGRQDRKKLYALAPDPYIPIITADLCAGVEERIDFEGNVLKPLSLGHLDKILKDLSEKKAESLAVCLLFSFRNPEHERKIKEKALEYFNFVSISSEVLPEYREYERASTTILNAYVSPILAGYIEKLDSSLKKRGARDFKIMESGGGILPAEEACNHGVRTILSGPAAGVAGAFQLAKVSGYDRIITLDMGGTSTDVSLCDGFISETREGRIEGLPIRVPMVDIVTIGAGGGSIARVDPGGVIRVGPQSAGSNPGPAAFGKGEEPTVTDAHLVLGTISPDDFLGGSVVVDPRRSLRSVKMIADELGISMEEAAAGIVRIAIAHMERALRVVSLERGHDPSFFVLIPFGGAGPVHAPYLAENLGVGKIMIPRHPGVLSAMGMLMCDFRMDFSHTVLSDINKIDDSTYRDTLKKIYERVSAFLERNYFHKAGLDFSFDMRYRGQSFDLNIKYESLPCSFINGTLTLPMIPAFEPRRLKTAFMDLHKERYGFSHRDQVIEIVNFRVDLMGRNPGPVFKERVCTKADPSNAEIGRREVTLLDGNRQLIPVLERTKLLPGSAIKAPAFIRQYDTSVIVPPGWNAVIDGFDNIIMEKEI